MSQHVRQTERAPTDVQPGLATGIRFRSAAYIRALQEIELFARDPHAPLLIEGESGTGKTIIARHVHRSSPRSSRPFEAVVLSALEDSLANSELFGHVAGAFTDAKNSRAGAFAMAQGGTIFLDEIGKASGAVQQKLLHAVEYGEIRPLGSDRTVRVDVRIVAASNVSLESQSEAGLFLPDLYARLGITPFWDARGRATYGVFADGTYAQCQGSNPLQCAVMDWPSGWAAYDRPNYVPLRWHGTLLEDKRDHAGTYFRRNRSYDPQTGRFTQEDPIGLAGGLNLYGFANGDPVNFSDPFGLWPCPELCGAGASGGVVAVGGAVLGGVSAGAIAAVAVPAAVVVGLALWASQDVVPMAADRSIPGALVSADATAYRPGGRFSGKTKGQIDRDATGATGQAGTCEYCGITLVPVPGSPTSTEYDHLTPKSKGGSNSPGNGRRSCRNCNREFGNKEKPDPRKPREQQP